ncbi:MAG: DMT family transporter [bacterium]|nr:DMT family transporter [bacterium]
MGKNISQKQLGLLALFATVFLWGPGPVVTKLALEEVPQFSLAFLGRLLALVCMVFIARKGKAFVIEKKDVGMFFLAGLFGQGLNLGLFFYAIQHTSAMTAQAIFALAPVATALFAFAFLKERITTLQLVGTFIALGGALLITMETILLGGSWNGGAFIGNIVMVFAMLSWVAYILISKKLSVRYSPVTITLYSFLVGSLLFLPLALVENVRSMAWIDSIGFQGWFGVFYQGIFASVLAFLAYQTGLKLTSAFTAGLVLYLNPIATALVAVPVLGERLSTFFVVGTGLILFGSFIATQFERMKNHIRRKSLA